MSKLRVIAPVSKGCSVVVFIHTKDIVYRVTHEKYGIHLHPDKVVLFKAGNEIGDDIERTICWRKDIKYRRTEFDRLIAASKLHAAMQILLNHLKAMPRDNEG